MLTTIFLTLLFLVIYNHIIYPVFLKFLPMKHNKTLFNVKPNNNNKVAVVVTAYNEDKFIENKIKNFFNLNYKNKHLFVYNDGSSDNTFNILKKYRNHKNVTVINKPENKGKIDSINLYIENHSKDYDFTVFSDASAYLENNFIENIMGHFNKQNISVVSSAYYPHKNSEDIKYWNFQRKMKMKEEVMGNVLGVHGSGYMIRNKFLNKLPINSINDDFILPSSTIKMGGKVVYSNVPSYEMENDKSEGLNYTRRVRIGAGNLQQVFSSKHLLNIFVRPFTAINFFSMKVLRTLMPFILLGMTFCVPFIENEFIQLSATIGLASIVGYILILLAFKKLQNVRFINIPFYILKSYYYSGVGACYFIIAKRIKGWYNPLFSIRVAFIKRTFDLVSSTILLTLSLPVLLFGIIALKIENFNAPIFFKQKRVGMIKDGKENIFEIIKLRSMIVDAEKSTGAVLAQANDPRVTRVGRFLRKTRIDEIPQFFNVLKGDMSLVGPRPERPEIMAKIKKDFPYFYKRTENVKPGITGLAQVKIGYNQSLNDSEKKFNMDKKYQEMSNESMFNGIYEDIKIMFSTVGVVLTMKGI